MNGSFYAKLGWIFFHLKDILGALLRKSLADTAIVKLRPAFMFSTIAETSLLQQRDTMPFLASSKTSDKARS